MLHIFKLSCIIFISAAISVGSSLLFFHPASCPTFFRILFKLWMMKSWRGSFVGSTWRGSFESSISGGKLRDPINRALQQDNAYMHATIAADHEFPKLLWKGMIILDGTDVACIGIVKAECQ